MTTWQVQITTLEARMFTILNFLLTNYWFNIFFQTFAIFFQISKPYVENVFERSIYHGLACKDVQIRCDMAPALVDYY